MTILKLPGMLLGVAVLIAGGAMYYGAGQIPQGFGYDAVGPGAFPKIIAVGLMVAGALCLFETVRTGPDEGEPTAFGQIWVVLLVSAALLAMVFGVRLLGWVPMSALVFLSGAIAFGSRSFLRDGLIGLLIGLVTLLSFNLGLGLDLPLGVLAPLVAHFG